VSTLFVGLIGGFVAWIATTAAGQPLLRFFQLRSRAAFILARYDGLPWIENSEAEPAEKGWLKKRKEAFDEIGSELIAFADTNSIIAQTLAKSRYFALRAGNDLRLLGAVYPGTNSWTDIRKVSDRPSDLMDSCAKLFHTVTVFVRTPFRVVLVIRGVSLVE
jgi:hypothetical protein